jgi:DNA replication protein DnaC
MMERSQILDAMGELKLYGMKAAYDELVANAVKRQHVPQQVVGDLICAEISEKQARSVRYQMTIARMPLARDIEDFRFDGTPINETLIRDLGRGEFLDHRRNVVLVGGTGTGKTQVSIAAPGLMPRGSQRSTGFDEVIADQTRFPACREPGL